MAVVNETSLEELFIKKQPRIIKQLVARKIDPYDAEDIVQEAFYRALKYEDSFDPEKARLDQWFGGILNRCQKDFARDQRMGGLTVEVEDHHIFTDDDFGEDQRAVRAVEDEINSIRSEQARMICHLYFIKQYSMKEITEVLDVCNKVVNTETYRFKMALRAKHGDTLR